MAPDARHCLEPGCDDNGGEGFKNAVALRGHHLGKHTIAQPCEICGKPYKDMAQHLERAHPIDAGGGEEPTVDAGAPAAGAEPSDEATAERRPQGPTAAPPPPASKRRLRDKIKGGLWGEDRPPAAVASNGGGAYDGPREKAPKARQGARFTTAPIWQMVWGGTGRRLERTGVDVPVGRVLQFQEPMAGDIIDRLIARTWVDRILQPFASKTEDLEALYALLGLPAAVAMMERSDEAFATMRPMVESMIRANLVNMAPVVKKQQQEAKKFAEAVAVLDINLPPNPDGTAADPVQGILWSIFTPPPPPQEPADEPATATT